MKTENIRKTIRILSTVISSLVAGAVMPAHAANVSLTGADAGGTTSFSTAGKWNNGQAPSAANDYFTSAYFMRTPVDGGSTTWTFAGHSLTLQQPTSSGVRSVIVKSGNNDTFVINNFTNAFGGILENGGSGNVSETFTGNYWTIAGNSAVVGDQGSIIIGYPLVGASGVILTNSGGNAAGITYNGNNSAFQGIFCISTINFGNGGGNSTLILNAANSQPANPATLTPNQIWINAGCTLQDNVGITFNNANGGFLLNGGGTATINAASTTLISEPITDFTNGVSSSCSLTKTGSGTLVLSNPNNNYTAGTIISAGVLQMGVDNAIPGNTIAGDVTDNSVLDLNGHNATINGLSGSGVVDDTVSAAATLTIGANGDGGSFTGTLQNSSSGALTVVKVGSGTETVSGYTYSGNTVVAGGALNLSTTASLPSTPGNLIVSNAVLNVNAGGGTALPANSILISTNGTVNLSLTPTGNGLSAAGNLTLLDNATNNFNFGTLTSGNPTAAAINVSGSISASGSNIVLNLAATGLKSGTFTLIKYGSGTLAGISNFQLNPPPGVVAALVNNTGNKSLDVQITATPNQLAWNGVLGTSWNLTAANWTNLTSGGISVFQQYTNGSVIAGDAITFDDTLTNDLVNPQPTNVVLNSRFYAFPIVFNSTLPYSIAGTGGILGVTSLTVSNTGTLTLLTSNSYTGGTIVNSGTLIITNDSALGSAAGLVTLGGGTLEISGNTTGTRPVKATAASTIDVPANTTAQMNGTFSGSGTVTKTDNGTLALGGAANAFGGSVYVAGGTLNVTAGSTTLAATTPSSIGYENGSATMNWSSSGTFTAMGDFWVGGSDLSGTYNPTGAVTITAGTVKFGGPAGNNAHYGDGGLVIGGGNNYQNAASGTLTVNGGTVVSTNDMIVGFAGMGTAMLAINSGTVNVGPAATKWMYLGKWDTVDGNVTMNGGNLNLMNNTAIKFSAGNGSTSGTNVFTLNAGAVTFYSDSGTTVGGTGDLNLAQSGSATANSTFNLNGGTLLVPQIGSASTTPTRVFNFNGGTLKAAKANATFLNLGTGTAIANVRNGGAIVDDGGFAITIAQGLAHSTVAGDNATDGGLTKKGAGTLTLTGANSYTGPTTNNAGQLLINGSLTNASSLAVNAGVVQFGSSVSIQGPTTVSNNATLGLTQIGSTPVTIGNLTLNGAASGNGALLSFTPGSGYNSAVPMANCGTFTLNGTNSVFLAAANLGANALLKYSAFAGSGNCTNLTLPQGATGYVSNSVANSTLYVVITSAGPGLVWTGTNAASPNLWDLNTTTNWLVSGTPTSYHQIIAPGDAVTFNDSGSGSVTLNVNASPASLVISNSSKNYTFSGNGSVNGSTGILKQGAGTVTMNLTNNYSGDTVLNGGTLQLGVAAALPSTGNLIVGTNATLKVPGYSVTAQELSGAGIVDNNGGNPGVLTVGGAHGGTWNGTVTNTGGGGFALHKNGTGTWIVGGKNYFYDGQSFTDIDQINQGTTVITNGGLLDFAYLQLQIASGAGQTATVVVADGTLVVTNNVLSVGYLTNATGTLIVNGGTVDHSGYASGSFAAVPNSIDVGAQGATGTLIVNGGQVLNDQPLYLGDGGTSSGSLYLNGGLVRASVLEANGTPLLSTANFNGGTLQAATNTSDFLLVSSLIYSNGLVLDDNGYSVTIASQTLQAGDTFNGGLTKTGTGTVYLDSGNSYTGTTVVNHGTLAGIGTITGPVVVNSSGIIGAGDAGSIGTFNVNGALTVNGAASLRINKTGNSPSSDLITGITTANYGGTLIITNVTSDATALVAGDTFTLFSASAHTGNFASIAGSPGTGLRYSFNPASGVLSVVTGPDLSQNQLTNSITGGGSTLSLSWSSGWKLQAQTNNLATGLSGNWATITDGTVTSMNITLNSTNPAVFYRLTSQ